MSEARDALAVALAQVAWDGIMSPASDFEEADAILAALPDGWTLARTQDAKDGEALRLLREALNDGGGYPIEVRWWTSPPQDDWQLRVIRPRVFVNSGNHPTIAEAADACREAVTR